MAIFGRIWWLVKWTLALGIAVALGVGVYVYYRVDEEIRRHAERILASHYSDLEVHVRSARWVEGEGVEIHGVSILEPGAAGPQGELAYIDEVFLDGVGKLENLLAGTAHIERIIIRRPTINITHRADEAWSASKLVPLPRFGVKPPVASVEDGRVVIFDPQKNPTSTLELRQLYLSVKPEEGEMPDDKRQIMIEGRAVGDHLRWIEFQGQTDRQAEHWRVDGTVNGLELSSDLNDALPGKQEGWLKEIAGLQGQLDLEFKLNHEINREVPLEFAVSGGLEQGRLAHPRLPYPLADVRARWRADNKGLKVDGLVARHGQTTLWLTAHSDGLTADSHVSLEARCRQMVLDDRLVNSLPAKLRVHWNKFLPIGTVDADVKLNFDGTTWNPELRVACHDVSFTYHKFPYRLQRGTGTLELIGTTLSLDLMAYSETTPVHLDGKFENPGQDFTGKITTRGEGLQINNKLLTALPAETRRAVQALNPRGTVDFYAEIGRTSPQETPGKYIWIGLQQCAVKHDNFPYPIENIRGTIEGENDEWTFHKLQGTNDSGFIACEGKFQATETGKELLLQFDCEKIPLEVELRDALNPGVQQLWTDLKPHGTVDIDCELNYQTRSKKLSVTAKVDPLPGTTSIEPTYFPYRMDNLQGTMVYRDGHVDLQNITAEHGQVKMQTGGRCEAHPDGRWLLSLEDLSVDRLQLDHDLHRALPIRLRTAFDRLGWQGPLSIRNSFLELSGSGMLGESATSRWRLFLDTHGGAMNSGVRLHNIHGGMALEGTFDGQHLRSWGTVNVDSVSYEDFQFTGVTGPIWIDDETVRLGAYAQRTPAGQQPPRLTAQAYGGQLAADAWVTLEEVPRFYIRASLANADLKRCTEELFRGPQDLKGVLSAEVDLTGTTAGSHTFQGSGTTYLRNADIYELPVMVSMLKLLSIRQPDTTAFSKSDINFRIDGNHIYFDRIDFNGDAISLLGKGQMDFQSRLDLTFHSVVGRDEYRIPIIHEVLGEASKQVLLIHVQGTLDNPVTRKEAFPGLNQALQQLQVDVPTTIGRRP